MPSGVYVRTKKYTISEEGRKNMSEAQKKNPSRYWLGKKFNRESVEKSIKTRKERYNPENHNHWKGGVTKIHKQIRNCFQYRQWRSDIFTRDNFTCQECNKRGCYLEAHHIKRFSEIIKEYNIKSVLEANNCGELWNLNNGITLCLDCHNKTKKKSNVE